MLPSELTHWSLPLAASNQTMYSCVPAVFQPSGCIRTTNLASFTPKVAEAYILERSTCTSCISRRFYTSLKRVLAARLQVQFLVQTFFSAALFAFLTDLQFLLLFF
mmetsp:Transcript_7392/g.14144  ORF Transcript_7392/g.14144 Transcript_7392/m.14144 type:complete len:106 (+) Transcript_7392:189-506(+)